MIPQLKKQEIPDSIYQELQKCAFVNRIRSCNVYVDEKNAITYIHPESFDYSEVYGNLEIIQEGNRPPVVSKFEFEKNKHSFEQEAVGLWHGKGI